MGGSESTVVELPRFNAYGLQPENYLKKVDGNSLFRNDNMYNLVALSCRQYGAIVNKDFTECIWESEGSPYTCADLTKLNDPDANMPQMFKKRINFSKRSKPTEGEIQCKDLGEFFGMLCEGNDDACIDSELTCKDVMATASKDATEFSGGTPCHMYTNCRQYMPVEPLDMYEPISQWKCIDK